MPYDGFSTNPVKTNIEALGIGRKFGTFGGFKDICAVRFGEIGAQLKGVGKVSFAV